MDSRSSAAPFQTDNIPARLQKSLPDDILILVQAAGSVATKRGVQLYVVGGFVRDLMLGRPNLDLDLVVAGSAIAMAKAMSNRFGGEVQGHERFGTAKWRLAGSSFTSLPSVDFVGARRESYPHPGALPVVEPGSIEQDLQRRDFTINTLAICLGDGCFGQLLDLFGGLADLRAGVIRVLHDRSFIEDPTRSLRAVRYETRLGFRLEPHTEQLLRAAMPLLEHISGERLTNELMLTLSEAEPEKALARLASLGLLAALHAGLDFDQAIVSRFARLRSVFPHPGPVEYLGLLTLDLPETTAAALAHRLSLSKAHSHYLLQLNQARALLPQLAVGVPSPSQVVRLLQPFRHDVLSALVALTDDPMVSKLLGRYLSEWSNVKPELNGDDLRLLGIPPGSLYREILSRLRDARLDGTITTRAEEETTARSLAAEQY